MWNEVAEKRRGLSGKEEAEKFIACGNSYLGIMKHYDTYKLRKKISRIFGGEISKSVIFSENFEKIRLVD